MESLVAKYFKKDPTDEEADARVKSSKRVQASMKAGILGSQPVYMSTGLRIAKGFKLLSDVDATQDATASGKAPILDKASVGLEAGLTRKDVSKESFRAGDDIIFAYQLHIIAEKGWRKKKVDVNIFAPQAAFLNDDKKVEDEESIGVSLATGEDLLGIGDQREDVSVHVVQLQDGDDKSCCISFQKA